MVSISRRAITVIPVDNTRCTSPHVSASECQQCSVQPDKSCSPDVLPTQLLKAVIDTITPFVTKLFNHSLLSGQIPEVLRATYLMPHIKMWIWIDSIYRPICNLPVSSKLLEWRCSFWLISTCRAHFCGFNQHIDLITQQRRPS